MASMSKTTSELKQEFIQMLINNGTIVNLLNSGIETPDELINVQIFPRLKVKYDSTNDARTYIGMKLDYPSITNNDAIKNCSLTFMIISNNGDLKTTTGDSKVDLLAEEIIKMFNFNHNIMFTFKLSRDIENPYDENFYYRRLEFETQAANSLQNMLNVSN